MEKPNSSGPQSGAGQASIGSILIKKQIITEEQLQRAVERQRESGEFLGQIMMDMGFLTQQQMVMALSEQLDTITGPLQQGIPDLVDESQIEISPEAVGLISGDEAVKALVMPLSLNPKTKVLRIGVMNDRDTATLEDLRLKIGLQLDPVLVSREFLEEAWQTHYRLASLNTKNTKSHRSEALDADFKTHTTKLTQETVTPFINRILMRAAELKVSDIHIDPFEDYVSVRFRMDGRLYQAAEFPKSVYPNFMGRLKIMSNIDVGDKKLTYDGRITFKIGVSKKIDYRISILNSQWGERVVLRIQRESHDLLSLSQLSLPKFYLDLVRQKLKIPHGMVIVTGPTGSGKTTTLYAFLNELADLSRNVLTIEDPIEITIPGTSQIQTDAERGLTFDKILRSVLRQDPDVIMIGEIRDEETAQIAVRAAMTGHLVLCSLHTKDAISAIVRLEDMNVPPYYIAPALNMVVGQRLVRLLCDHCKKPAGASKQLLLEIGFTPQQIRKDVIYQPGACPNCNMTGYSGRIPVFEVLDVKNNLRDAISAGEKQFKLLALAKKSKYIGFGTILREYLRRGRTSLEDALPYLLDR